MSKNNNLDDYYEQLKIPNDSSLEFIEGAYGFFKANPTEDAVYNQKEIAFQKILAQKKPQPAVSFELEDVENGFTNVSKVGQTTKNSNQQQEQKIQRTQSLYNKANDKPSKDFKTEENEANKQKESENVNPKEEEKPNEAAKKPEFRKKSSLHPRQLKKPAKNIAIEHEIFLTPEEMLNGCTKEVKVGRKMEIIGKDWVDDKTFSVEIKPKVAIETRITFEQEGHKSLKALPGDVVFIIKDRPNETLEKDKSEKELEKPNVSSSFKQGNKQMPEDTKQNTKLENAMITKHDLWISLDEVLKGCKKKIQIKRKRFDNDQINFEDKTVEIPIKPGIETGTQIKLSQEGDQLPDESFADAVFTVHDEKHPQLERRGPDVIYVAKVSQKQLDEQVELIIPALENRIVKIKLDEEVAENMNKCLFGQGLPYQSDTKMRGSLIVQFKIVIDKEAKEIVFKADGQPNINPKETIKNENNFKEATNKFSSNKLPPNKLELKLTLEEMLRGCVKNEKITRKHVDGQGKQKCEDVLLHVNVKPGSIPGTQINVDNEGDREYLKRPADVIFTVTEEPHSIFKLDGHDIVYTAKITSHEAILGCKLKIPTLENIPANFEAKGGITLDTVRSVNGYGLPYLDEPTKRGDIKIKFDIIFEQDKIQYPPVEYELPLTLEQILQGTVERLKIKRQVKNALEEKDVTVDVMPGTLAGTRFTFPREGDQKPGQIPADVVFIVRDAQHETFKRSGADIEYTAEITKNQLVNGGKLEIPTLENTKKSIYIDGIVVGKTVKRISGQGLPNSENPAKRGDILVHFKLSKTKDPDIEHDLPLTLENIFHGCTKRIKINYRILDKKGNEDFKDKIVVIDVKPGTIEGTEFRYPNLGDENPDSLPADIVFRARDKPHMNFIRNEANIVHKVMITKSEIDQEIEFEIPTLEGKAKLLKLHKFTKTGGVKKFGGEGLPIDGNSDKRGDFIVQFEIVKDDRKDPEVEHELPISLEHVLYGNSKKMKINRTILDHDGNKKTEEKIVTLNIKPGTEKGKRFTFVRQDDIRPGYIPGDVVFVITEKPHDIFKRNGANLEVTKTVFSDKVDYQEFKIPTLENTNKDLKMYNISKDSLGKVAECGLPYSFEPSKRGDILVKFEIIPKISGPKINSQQKKEISDYQTKSIDQTSNKQTNKTKSDEPNNEDTTDNGEFQDNSQNGKTENNINEPQIQVDPIYQDVELTLKQVLDGGSKYVTVRRETINPDGRKNFDNKSFNVQFKPGVLAGQKFLFEKEGNQDHGKIPGDVVLVVKDAPHQYFKRNGPDLEYISKIANFESKRGFQRNIPTLNSGDYNLVVEQFKTTEIIEGLGLPYYEKPDKRGNIVVKFDIFGKDKDVKIEENSDLVQMPEIEIKLYLTLENILHGHTEHFQFPVTVIDSNGERKPVTKILNVVVKPGTKSGEKIVFPKHGNQYSRTIPADVVFVILDKPHDKFIRNGVDIEYIAKISSEQAKGNCQILIPTLESDSIPLNIYKPIGPGSMIAVERIGLPHPENPTMMGNLNVRFEIVDSKGDYINEQKKEIFQIAKSQKSQSGNTMNEVLAKEYDLFVSLEEILNGCIKKANIERILIDSEGNKNKEIVELSAGIKPGTEAGTKLCFPGEGDRIYGKQPEDVVLIVRDEPHTLFVRKGVDIVYRAKITTDQAQNGFSLKVPTLEEVNLIIQCKDKVGSTSVFSIKDRGLPHPDNTGQRGQIKIFFEIIQQDTSKVRVSQV